MTDLQIIVLQFSKREEVDRVVDDLKHIVERFGFASLGDLYDMTGIPNNYQNHRIGWKEIKDYTITELDQGFRLEFPPMKWL